MVKNTIIVVLNKSDKTWTKLDQKWLSKKLSKIFVLDEYYHRSLYTQKITKPKNISCLHMLYKGTNHKKCIAAKNVKEKRKTATCLPHSLPRIHKKD